MSLSRRSLLFSVPAAGVAMTLPLRATQDATTKSGLVTGKPVPLPYTEIAGFLSKDQVRWHHDSHYGGALKAFAQLDAAPTGNHRKRIAKANSVVLHELYFAGMTAKKIDPGRATLAAIDKRFGTLERWRADFEGAAKSCRGWAVLAYHPVNHKLYNIATDSHADGPAWFGVPLVIVDMYEHSYYIDYQNKKADYVSAFGDHIDWGEVERRVRAV